MEYSDFFSSSFPDSEKYVEREVQRVISELKEEISELKLTKGATAKPFRWVFSLYWKNIPWHFLTWSSSIN